jgi:IS30 family transposase
VAVEYFTKWVEVKPASIKKFFWQNITNHYGVPRHITVDNTKYFDNAMFKDFCHQIGTKVTFASVYHPQTNGVVEKTNGLIFEAIKKSLKVKKENGRRLCHKQYGAIILQCVEKQTSRHSS